MVWVYKLQMGTPHRLTREERLRKPLSYEDAHGHQGAMPRPSRKCRWPSSSELSEFGLPPSTARYKGREMAGAQFMGVDANYWRIANSSLGRRPLLHRRRTTCTAAMSP